jgi:ABC-type sugar transport system ATPase subunit
MADNLIEFQGISKSFPGVKALSDVKHFPTSASQLPGEKSMRW